MFANKLFNITGSPFLYKKNFTFLLRIKRRHRKVYRHASSGFIKAQLFKQHAGGIFNQAIAFNLGPKVEVKFIEN